MKNFVSILAPDTINYPCIKHIFDRQILTQKLLSVPLPFAEQLFIDQSLSLDWKSIFFSLDVFFGI
jgi:hypothetical protein